MIAECKRDGKVISGGFNGPGFDPIGTEGPYTETFMSRPESKTAWTSQGFNGNPPEGKYVGYAYCSSKLPKPVMFEDSTTLTPEEQGSVSVSCEAGQEAVSGGFGPGEPQPPSGQFVYPFSSYRSSEDEWTAAGRNNDDISRDLTVYVLCAKQPIGLKQRSKTVPTGNNENAVGVAKCRRDQLAVSGGFIGLYEASPDRSSYVFESRRKGRAAWKASAGAYTEGDDVPWEVQVLCAPKSKLG